MNIFIYGDSFSVSSDIKYTSWVDQLHNNHSVINRSAGGASNHYIFLKFIDDLHRITSDDLVVFCWSENHRYYYSNPEKLHEIGNRYYQYFYNERLLEIQSELYLDKIKTIVQEQNLRMLFFWSFPSGYSDSNNWVDAKFITDSHLTYSHTFENEVRPALMYFSRIEIPNRASQTSDDIIEFFCKDNRANHIGNQKVHDEIFKIVDDVFQHRQSGQINLKDRLENGS